MTPSLLRCMRSCPANGYRLGLCRTGAQTDTHLHKCNQIVAVRHTKNTNVSSYAVPGVQQMRVRARTHTPHKCDKCKENVKKNVQTERLSHSSIPLHTWLPPQNMPSARHSTARRETRQRWKTLYHSYINNLAPVRSASDNAQPLVIYSLSPVLIGALRHTCRHTETSEGLRRDEGRQAKRQGHAFRQQRQRQPCCLNVARLCRAFRFQYCKRCLCIF